MIAGAIGLSVGVGIGAERRWPEGAAVAARKALTVLLYVLMPPIVFFNLAVAKIDLDHGVGLGLSLLTLAVGAVGVWWVATRYLELERFQVGAVICCVIVANTTNLGYPMTVALRGGEELSTAVLYDVVVNQIARLLGAFAVGAAFGTKAGETPKQRLVAFLSRNPPLYAAIAGLLAPKALAPDVLVDVSQALAVIFLPVGFFAVGATLAEDAKHGELRLPPPLTRPVVLAVLTRLALVPALLLVLAAPLIDLPATYLLLAVMPCGLNSMIVSHAYGLDNAIIAEAITWSTAIVIAAALVSLLI